MTSEARFAIDQYTEIFVVEFEAKRQGITGTNAHLKLRKQRSATAIKRLDDCLISDNYSCGAAKIVDVTQLPEMQCSPHLPKGKMGEVITYAVKDRDATTRFQTDSKIPISNNHSERQLRSVALGCKNCMRVGHAEAGEKSAALHTIVAYCKQCMSTHRRT